MPRWSTTIALFEVFNLCSDREARSGMMNMTNQPTVNIKPNTTYRLTEDVKNPKPDKRQKYDWTAQPVWKAGMLFRAQEGHSEGISIFSGKFSHQNVRPYNKEVWDAIVPHLVEEIADFTHKGIKVEFRGDKITFEEDTDAEEWVYYGQFHLSDVMTSEFKAKVAIAICEACQK
jgi:hypothetical protein